MKLFGWFALFGMWAGSIAAQDVIVRTGDHPSFARLVLTIEPGTQWNILRSTSGFVLDFEDNVSIDVTRFYERIQRDRIQEITVSEVEAKIELELACNCFAEAFLWRSDQIVVDIKDPDADRIGGGVEITELDLNEVAEEPVLSDPPTLPTVTTVADRQQFDQLQISERRPVSRNLDIPNPLDDLTRQSDQVAVLERKIASGLSRALSQGLLQPRQPMNDFVQDPTDGNAINPDLASLLADVEGILAPGLTARTSVDQAVRSNTDASDSLDPVLNCLPETLVDVHEWATDAPFAHQIGALRENITGEFDRTDSAAIEALAKAYVHFGFGREAIQTLGIDGEASQSRQVLTTIARIVDDLPIGDGNLETQISCSGSAALWGFLAHNEGPQTATPNVQAIAVAFKLLPPDLRRHLAPRLAHKLSKLNYDDLASDILSIALQTSYAPAEATVTASEIEENQGDAERAEETLKNLAADNPRMTSDAALKLVGFKFENGSVFSADDLTMLRTMRFESQDTKVESDLFIAELRVLTALGELRQVLKALDQDEVMIGKEDKLVIYTGVADAVLEGVSDVAFLEFAFDPLLKVPTAEQQNAVASRLLDIGFPEMAAEYISEATAGSAMAERRYLQAEIAVEINEFERVAAHLSGINSPRAQLIRAKAGVRPTDEAIAELSSDERASMDWRFGNWSRLATQDDPLLRSVSERVQSAIPQPPIDGQPLTAGRTLISDSASLRAEMLALLERYQFDQ